MYCVCVCLFISPRFIVIFGYNNYRIIWECINKWKERGKQLNDTELNWLSVNTQTVVPATSRKNPPEAHWFWVRNFGRFLDKPPWDFHDVWMFNDGTLSINPMFIFVLCYFPRIRVFMCVDWHVRFGRPQNVQTVAKDGKKARLSGKQIGLGVYLLWV